MNDQYTPALRRRLPDESHTVRLAEALACVALPGDRILLQGDLGSGKTAFARAFLRALADDEALEVPSPSYTIMQTYEVGGLAAAHLDLYRIGGEDELPELGLDELGDAILLVEWPERAQGHFSGSGVELRFELDPAADEARRVSLVPRSASWRARLERLDAVERTIERAGLSACRRRRLAGDASTRRYERLHLDDGTLVLMDSPAQPDPGLPGEVPYSRQVHLAESATPYVALAEALAARDLSAPRIVEADLEAGVLVLEDLGQAGVLDAAGLPVPERYLAAAELLAEIAGQAWPRTLEGRARHEIPDFDMGAMLAEAMLMPQWFAPKILGRTLPEEAVAAYEAAWRAVLADFAAGRRETGLMLRDFHSPNIVWLPERTGVQRIGLLDFQDALIGPVAYDLASLAMDARTDVSPELFEAILAHYLAAREQRGHAVDEDTLRADVAVMGAQRTCKVLGIFARLAHRDGKPRYLAHLPRLHGYLDRALAEPLLLPVREWYEAHLPASVRRSSGAAPAA